MQQKTLPIILSRFFFCILGDEVPRYIPRLVWNPAIMAASNDSGIAYLSVCVYFVCQAFATRSPSGRDHCLSRACHWESASSWTNLRKRWRKSAVEDMGLGGLTGRWFGDVIVLWNVR
jgi:hypothetical protein